MGMSHAFSNDCWCGDLHGDVQWGRSEALHSNRQGQGHIDGTPAGANGDGADSEGGVQPIATVAGIAIGCHNFSLQHRGVTCPAIGVALTALLA